MEGYTYSFIHLHTVICQTYDMHWVLSASDKMMNKLLYKKEIIVLIQKFIS